MSRVSCKECPICGSKDFSPYRESKDYFVSKEVFSIRKCVSCGFAFTDLFPDESEMKGFYRSESYISHSNTQKGFVNRLYHLSREWMLRRKVRLIVGCVGSDNKRLLDVGCGTGHFLSAIKHLGWKGTGIEQSDEASRFAREEFGLEVYPEGSLYDEPFEPFDVITLWHVLEHLEPLRLVMGRLHDLLKSEGRLVIALPNKKSFDQHYYKSDWAAFDVPRHLWHFSAKNVDRLASEMGFEVVGVRPMYLDGFYISILSERNRGNRCSFIRGLWLGFRGFVASLQDVQKSSSLIYILEKK